jgi:hypothetical protein
VRRKTILQSCPKYQGLDIRSIINLAKLESRVIADLMVDQSLKVVQDFRNLDYKDNARKAWEELIALFSKNKEDKVEEDKKAVRIKLNEFFSAFGGDDKQKNALEREIFRLRALHKPDADNLVQSIRKDTGQGKLVVLDLSLVPLQQAIRIAEAVLRRIFNYNLWGITQGKAKPVIAVFEEAQNVLNKKAVEEGTTVFVRWAKEGRKFKLGLIYVTQQPGAVAEEIVSQTDNFFVMHMLNKGDIDVLTRANRHYDGVVAQFLGDETVVGNAYIYSAPRQPYVFPARLLEFTPTIFDSTFGKFRLDELASYLKGRFTSNQQEVSKFVGAFSRVMYSWFTSQKSVSKPAWLDHDKQWITYSYAESLLKILGQANLMSIPDALKTGKAELPSEEIDEAEVVDF